MYHHREWKDVTKFTDGCDLAHRPSVHLFRLTDVVQDFFWNQARLLPVLPPRTRVSASLDRLPANVSYPLVGSLDLEWTTPAPAILNPRIRCGAGPRIVRDHLHPLCLA